MSELRYHLTLRLLREGKSFGPGPMRLLEGVQKSGSLQKAAEEMGMAYSKAWKTIRQIEGEWGFKLIHRKVGGMGGGSSRLTQEGEDLLARYVSMQQEIELAAQKAFQKYFQTDT